MIYDTQVTTIDGQIITLERYRGKLMLVVNVASQCGLTPQYRGLEELYRSHKDDLEVLAFPCNQFGAQEPGTESEIRDFCSLALRCDVSGLREDRRKWAGYSPVVSIPEVGEKGVPRA